jgi:hypothetical protein
VFLIEYLTGVVTTINFTTPPCIGLQINYHTLSILNLDDVKLFYLPFNNGGVTASLLAINFKWYTPHLIGYYNWLTVVNDYFFPSDFNLSLFITAP